MTLEKCWMDQEADTKGGEKTSEEDINACGYMRVHARNTHVHTRTPGEIMEQNFNSFKDLATTYTDFGMRATWSPILAFRNSVTLGSFFGFLKPQFAQF